MVSFVGILLFLMKKWPREFSIEATKSTMAVIKSNKIESRNRRWLLYNSFKSCFFHFFFEIWCHTFIWLEWFNFWWNSFTEQPTYRSYSCGVKIKFHKKMLLILLPPIPFLLIALTFMKLKFSTQKNDVNTILMHCRRGKTGKSFDIWHGTNLSQQMYTKCDALILPESINLAQTVYPVFLSFILCVLKFSGRVLSLFFCLRNRNITFSLYLFSLKLP